MSLKYYLKSSFFLWIVVGYVAVLISSCSATKSVTNIDFKKPVSYNRVKIEMSTGSLGGGLKGYIYLVPDTQICFRLWGPWGYEIGKGYIYPSKILFYNEINDVLITDLRSQIENLSGCVVDLSVFQSLLLGNVEGFIQAINSLNPDLLDTRLSSGRRRSTVQISHKVNHSEMNVYFFYQKGLLRSMQVKLKRDKSYTEVSFDFSDISYDRKICTFAF